MKKILAIIITAFMLLSNSIVFADDYSNHWSAPSINYLIDKGIVSGDSDGNLNPDANITRAEFAKVINRVFGYNDTKGDQFSDVSEGKWYYSEMKIARNAGYMKGDANGNANPEKGITRAEVCVIYARILKLDVNNTNTGFADDSAIPSWAKGAVSAMKDKGLLNGYSDNTFKADNPIKRGEAFTVVANQMNQSSAPVVSKPSNSGFSTGSSSGGGSGGGGGGYTPPVSGIPAAPSNLRWDKDDYTIRWAQVPTATSYEVKVELITEGTQLVFDNLTENITGTSYSLKSVIENLMNNDSEEKRLTQEIFKVSVIAKNTFGISVPAVLESVVYNNEFIDFPEIEFEQSYTNNVETMKFKWVNNENADYYKLEIDFAGDGSFELIGDEQIRNGEAELTPEQIDKIKGAYNMRVTAPSKLPNKVLSLKSQVTTVDLPLYGGEAEGYNLVYNERHFNNIKMNTSANFRLMQDIVLVTIPSFPSISGILDGNGKSVTFENLTSPLIGTLSGSVVNLHLYGSANLTGTNTGMLVGLINGGSVKNCVNNATCTLNGSYSGGIIGRNMGSITGCVNYGNIVSNASNTAAIVGESNGTITRCTNYGDITLNNSTSAHGGIVGMHQTTSAITECANYGDLITTGNATKVGGIAGEYRGASAIAFKNCLNSGNINVGSATGIAGGILASIPHENYDNLALENCYNVGNILIGGEDASNFGAIYHTAVPGVEGTKITNCYYLVSGTTSAKDGSTGLTDNELKSEPSFNGFDFEETWKIDPVTGYLYPQLISNPYKTAPEKLETPYFTDGVLPYNNGTNVEFRITVPSQASKIYIEAEYNGEIFSAEIPGNSQSDYVITIPSASFITDTTYNVRITAIGNGESYFNSDVLSFDYTHKRFMLRAPVINVNWYADNTDTITENDEFYRLSWQALEESGGLTVNKYKVEINGTEAAITTDLYYDIIPSDYTEAVIDVKLTAMYDNEIVSGTAEKNVDLLFAGEETVGNITFLLIGNERQLGNVSDGTLNYKVCNDFEVANLPGISEFSGIFDGNGKTITLNNSTSPFVNTLNASGKIVNFVFDGTASLVGTNCAMIAKLNYGIIENCINKAELSINGAYGGGFIGNNQGTINNCVNYGNATLLGLSTSPMVGESYRAITNCVNYGDITIPGNTTVHGGIVARYQTTSTVSQCANFGDITATGNASLIGGIAGEFRGNNTVGFENCFNAGNITTAYSAGKAAGIFSTLPHENYDNVTVKNCINTGVILIGGVDTTNADSIYFDAVSGAEGTTIQNCYYISSGDSVEKIGSTGLTSEQMKNKESFTGFDFDNIWQIPTDGTYLYPIFR